MENGKKKNKKRPDKDSPSTKTGSGDTVNPGYSRQVRPSPSLEEYIDGVQSGNRTVLSQAITLLESSKKENRNTGKQILESCLSKTGNAIRIGITGVPGVGKSTFIESLGTLILEEGHRLAVLAVDPSSSRSKGSILGDKTRMQKLANHPNAFIRPSPASGTLGGVTQTTRETMLLCEAAGYDTIFIETVGVGQSETSVYSMVDVFLLLMLAGAGDELQGIKRGIMEMADLIAINKADKENIKSANKARQAYENALALLSHPSSDWKPPVLTCSSTEGTGIKEIWEEIETYVEQSRKNSWFSTRRSEQARGWMYETINRRLKDQFYENPEVSRLITTYEKEVVKGEISPFKAAEKLLEIKSGSRRKEL